VDSSGASRGRRKRVIGLRGGDVKRQSTDLASAAGCDVTIAEMTHDEDDEIRKSTGVRPSVSTRQN